MHKSGTRAFFKVAFDTKQLISSAFRFKMMKIGSKTHTPSEKQSSLWYSCTTCYSKLLFGLEFFFSTLQWNFSLLQHTVWEHQRIPEEIHFRGRRKYTFQSNFSFDSIVRVDVCRLLKLSRVSQCISPDSSFLWKDRRAKIRSKRPDNNSTRAPTNCYNRTLSFSVFLPVRIAALFLNLISILQKMGNNGTNMRTKE